MTKNADYASIAPRYNAARPLYRKDTEFWAGYAAAAVSQKMQKPVQFLDLGCGNGRFSIVFAHQLNFNVTGIDSSAAMIREAAKNDTDHVVTWDVQDAAALTLQDESFDVVWISHLLHLVDNPQAVLAECYRVLKPGGMLIDRYSSLEGNLRKPERIFFPELAELDAARIPTQQHIEMWMHSAGFDHIISEHLQVPTFKTSEERLRRTAARVESGLTKISDAAYEAGLQALGEYIADHPNDPWILCETYTVTTARKSA